MRIFFLFIAAAWLLASCARPRTELEKTAAYGSAAELRRLLAGPSSGQMAGALVWAARCGNAENIPLLAEAGADLNRGAGVNGWTPLMHAIHKNRIESVAALLDAGADVNARGGSDATALMMAAGYGYANIVDTLARRGADVGARNRKGATALEYAITGVSDIDRWTTGECQVETVKALASRAPVSPALSARVRSKLAKCPEVAAALRRSF